MSDEESSGSQLVSLDEAYAVEEIRSHKVVNGVDFYLVKWLGYPEAQNTWEPADNLKTVKNMIEEFMERFKNAKKDREVNRKSGMDGKPKSEEDAVTPPQEAKSQPKQKPAPQPKDKKAVKGNSKPPKAPTVSEVSNVTNEKKKAPAVEEKPNNEHFKHAIKQSKPIPKKKPEEKETRESRRNDAARQTTREKDNRMSSEDEPVGLIASNPEIEISQGAPTKKVKLTEEIATQQPEHQIRKIHQVTIKNDEIFYQVEYARKNDQRVNMLPAAVVLRENPTAIAEFFQRRLKQISDDIGNGSGH